MEQWLIDVTQAHAHVRELIQNVGLSPASMPDLQDQRVISELSSELSDMSSIFWFVPERPGKPHQDAAQAIGRQQRLHPALEECLVLACGIPIMRKPLPEFRGEPESGIAGDSIHPTLGDFGAWRTIERCVDFRPCRRN